MNRLRKRAASTSTRTVATHARELLHGCSPAACVAAVGIQVAVFYLTPVVNRFYDGWPRGWLVLSVSILAALFKGAGPGLAALATGVMIIWWRGTYFTPMHPGLEVFAALGLTQILVIHRLQLTKRALLQRQDALEEERNRANYLYEVAHQANRAKDNFLAVLSHELRTPLNVILGYSRMMRSAMATPDFLRTTGEIIERNAMAQMRIVEDLLDVQRVIKAGIKIEPSPFDLRDLAQSVLESLHPVASAKRLHVAADVEHVRLEADRARIQQVLWNLLSNAIKFTPEGGCIGVFGFEEDESVVLIVEDSGTGIPPHFLPYVFEPFRQLDMSTTRRHGGLGLGLAIVKAIVDAHGGTIDAQCEGQGARFIVRLPNTAAKADGEEVAVTRVISAGTRPR